MRLPDEVAAWVDAYAERHGIKTRSEAIRRLVDEALTADERRAKRESAPVKRTRKPKAD
jgi:metal-responsive CopG/Arc/MetJ family transcriptional regulator